MKWGAIIKVGDSINSDYKRHPIPYAINKEMALSIENDAQTRVVYVDSSDEDE